MTNDSNTHDRLAEPLADVIAAALDSDTTVCTRVWEAWSYGTMGPDDFTPLAEDPDSLRNIADAVLAAGYRKPGTVSTVEALDALPTGSAILDGSGDAGQKLSGMWHFPETAPIGSSKVAKYGPVTVLYAPEATA